MWGLGFRQVQGGNGNEGRLEHWDSREMDTMEGNPRDIRWASNALVQQLSIVCH